MLVEQLPAFIDAQLDDFAEPHRFFLSMNKTSVRNTWSAAYVDFQSGRTMFGINYCDSLEEVGIRLEARVGRYMKQRLQRPRTLHNLTKSDTVGSANITEGLHMADTAPDQKELTYGQKLVNVRFNPSKDSVVDRLKQSAADMIDEIRAVNDQEGVKEGTDAAFLSDYAIRSIVTAQMAAVKRATWVVANKQTAAPGSKAAASSDLPTSTGGDTSDPLNQKQTGTPAAGGTSGDDATAGNNAA